MWGSKRFRGVSTEQVIEALVATSQGHLIEVRSESADAAVLRWADYPISVRTRGEITDVTVKPSIGAHLSVWALSFLVLIGAVSTLGLACVFFVIPIAAGWHVKTRIGKLLDEAAVYLEAKGT